MAHSCFAALSGSLAHLATGALWFGCCALCRGFSLCLFWAHCVFSTQELASLLCILPFCLCLSRFSLPRFRPLALWPLKSTNCGVCYLWGCLKTFQEVLSPCSYKEAIAELYLHAFFSKMGLSRNKPLLMGCLTFSPPNHGALSQEITYPTPAWQAKGQSEYWLGVEKGNESTYVEMNRFANQVASRCPWKLEMTVSDLLGSRDYYIRFCLVTFDLGNINFRRWSKNWVPLV